MPGKYNLIWHTFTEHLQLMFKELFEEEKHSDVTLISDDQIQFKAHKIVLRACSPVLRKIIDNNPCQHPLIYLRGIHSHEMESILEFMYLGEGRFYYERMGEFIQVAKDLEVKEISKSVEIPNMEEAVTYPVDCDEKNESDEDDDEPKHRVKSRIKQNQSFNQISSVTESSGVVFSQKATVQLHNRSKHEGIKYPCSHCDYEATTKGNLQVHIQSIHEGIKYPCDQCSYQATSKGSLQIHSKSKHEGIKYSCNHCDYQSAHQNNLLRHIQSIHEGIKYPCNQCNYKTSRQDNLHLHVQNKHGVMKYHCDLCDFQARKQGILKRHIQSTHGIKFKVTDKSISILSE